MPIPASRIAIEIVISTIFALCSNPIARKILEFIPEELLGPIFNNLRLGWKALSKPTKRKGLQNLAMQTHRPVWRDISPIAETNT